MKKFESGFFSVLLPENIANFSVLRNTAIGSFSCLDGYFTEAGKQDESGRTVK